MKLSPNMLAAVEMARKGGGFLERRPGGFWTWPDCPNRTNIGWPTESVVNGTQTVRALISRGVFEETDWRQQSGGLK